MHESAKAIIDAGMEFAAEQGHRFLEPEHIIAVTMDDPDVAQHFRDLGLSQELILMHLTRIFLDQEIGEFEGWIRYQSFGSYVDPLDEFLNGLTDEITPLEFLKRLAVVRNSSLLRNFTFTPNQEPVLWTVEDVNEQQVYERDHVLIFDTSDGTYLKRYTPEYPFKGHGVEQIRWVTKRDEAFDFRGMKTAQQYARELDGEERRNGKTRTLRIIHWKTRQVKSKTVEVKIQPRVIPIEYEDVAIVA